jgi:hypothetical protein
LGTISTIFRAASRFYREKTAALNISGIVIFAVHFVGLKNKFKKRKLIKAQSVGKKWRSVSGGH